MDSLENANLKRRDRRGGGGFGRYGEPSQDQIDNPEGREKPREDVSSQYGGVGQEGDGPQEYKAKFEHPPNHEFFGGMLKNIAHIGFEYLSHIGEKRGPEYKYLTSETYEQPQRYIENALMLMNTATEKGKQHVFNKKKNTIERFGSVMDEIKEEHHFLNQPARFAFLALA